MVLAGAVFSSTSVQAQQVLALVTEQSQAPVRQQVAFGPAGSPQAIDEAAAVPARLHRQTVYYATSEAPGTIIVDTPNTYLYLVLAHGKAIRYGIGVGREGFTWSGTERISRVKEWPDWFPPKEMIERQPYLPRFMAGGESNPLGARALYLGNTLYRIHGTNQPSTIGTFVSSGCIRLTNEDIEDLFNRVGVGTRVVVLPGALPPAVASTPPSSAASTQVPIAR
jgi:lipoprotein-anchoring transpeptidase ErfK/SrfK